MSPSHKCISLSYTLSSQTYSKVLSLRYKHTYPFPFIYFLFIFLLCVWVFCLLYVCVPPALAVAAEVRQHQLHRHWSYTDGCELHMGTIS